MAYQDQLSPEFLAQLKAADWQGLPVVGPDGNLYYGVTNQGGSNGDMGTLQSIYAASPQIAGSNTDNRGAPLPVYDTSGKQTGTRPYEPDSQYSDLMGILSVLGIAAGGAMLNGGLGGLSPGLESGTLANGVTVGGPMSVGGAAGTSLPSMGAMAGGGAAAMGAAGGGGAAAAGGGLSGLLGGGGSGLLGLGSTLLGGALGGQGQKKDTTETKDIPEWLKPSVFGLLAQTDALRNKQMAPGYMQGYDDMRSVGQGLLNQPIAGNGVGMFPSLFRK